ncbi:polyadenylate-binding protein-interacting protein 5-like [Cornus florida]|uniref:polyadenylate-binding protein-interacting protein 5-like n=1 Tax=Cornus florida TaxID=4283 RepID=UPI00289F21D9|nr:polyadenylate-binding protein-interacting protein 5-like [Cornus florida]XP_059642280.1 polyadenylate-binding protein-interacting protein 5-like [Cornus florida]
MKTGTSSLNPYAASYIPLSQRGAPDGNKDYKLTAEHSKNGNETIWLGLHSEDTTQNQLQSKVSQNYDAYGILDSKLTAHSASASYGSLSHNPSEMIEKQILDEEFDMGLAYLQMTFPGISDESLSDVYLANNGDLEATVDMLNHLEMYTVDSDEDIPGSSKSVDVSEPGSSSKAAASLKLKKLAGEVGGSSGSSDSALVS